LDGIFNQNALGYTYFNKIEKRNLNRASAKFRDCRPEYAFQKKVSQNEMMK
jgi:hypothetical protein